MKAHPLVLLVSTLALPAQDPPPAPAAEPAQECGARVELANIWKHLRSRHDRDGDGKVTAAEYTRGQAAFSNFDRDGDGVLTAKDFPAGAHFNGFNPMLLRMADTDEDGRVPAEEWRAFVAELDDDGDGTVTADETEGHIPPDIRERWNLVLLSFDQDLDGAMTRADLDILFRDADVDGNGVIEGRELQPWKSDAPRPEKAPPKPGEEAPDFELPFAEDPERTFRLSSFRGKKPVALIFGSYT